MCHDAADVESLIEGDTGVVPPREEGLHPAGHLFCIGTRL
jgi:hypothetical protein